MPGSVVQTSSARPPAGSSTRAAKRSAAEPRGGRARSNGRSRSRSATARRRHRCPARCAWRVRKSIGVPATGRSSPVGMSWRRRQEAVGVDREHVVATLAPRVAGEVEEGVAGEARHGRAVCGGGLPFERQRVVVVERVDHAHRQRAGKALFAVARTRSAARRARARGCAASKTRNREPRGAAVQRVRPAVGAEPMGRPVEREARIARCGWHSGR